MQWQVNRERPLALMPIPSEDNVDLIGPRGVALRRV